MAGYCEASWLQVLPSAFAPTGMWQTQWHSRILIGETEAEEESGGGGVGEEEKEERETIKRRRTK